MISLRNTGGEILVAQGKHYRFSYRVILLDKIIIFGNLIR